MPVAATALYLRLTNGTITCNFVDGTNYQLINNGWSPKIPKLRTSQLGGAGPYEEVEEQIDLDITGGTASDIITNVENLYYLIDQAERFNRGQNVAAVRLQVQPIGNTLGVLEALVIGGSLELPQTFNDLLMVTEVASARLTVKRRGLWLNPTAETASSTAAANPTVQSATLATALTISAPTKISVAVGALISVTHNFTILYASAANRLALFEAESGLASGATTSVADAAALARGGNVARYTPPDTGLDPMIDLSISSMDSTIRRVAVYAAVRNNSATTSWLLQAHLQSSGVNFPAAPFVPIDVDTNTPKLPHIVFLGTLSTPVALSRLLISAQASAVSGTLDMDYIAIVAVDDDRSGVIALQNQAGTTPQEVDPQPLSALTPRVTVGGFASGYTGDAMIHTNGQTVYTTVLATVEGREFFRLAGSGPATVNNTLTVTRNNAYLTPR